ncbi:MAG: helix-turn-helix domain-containing protein [Parachlamydia sp.]|nr:helix-turn-helix domain-containing protein [Parachlamydia sp.]
MWARTKTHHTDGNVTDVRSTLNERKNWNDFFKNELENHPKQGLYLKGLRLREGYSQKELGALIEVSRYHISAMEHGTRPIDKEQARRLGQVFKVPYKKFL